MSRTKAKANAAKPRVLRPGPMGWRGRGRGTDNLTPVPMEWRGTTRQVCGLYPASSGSSAPAIGAPLGRQLDRNGSMGGSVCCDPISWFLAGMVSNPSAFFLSNPGLGKSTVARRMVMMADAFGYVPMVLGDLKPDQVDNVRALGGQVIRIGPGGGHLNVLDSGQSREAEAALRAAGRSDMAEQLRVSSHARTRALVAALLTIVRKSAPTDREENILDRAIRLLADRHQGVPVLPDLLHMIQNPPEDLRRVALDRGDLVRYAAITENLEASLIGLIDGGRLGSMFAHPTSEPQRRDRAVVYDVSGLQQGEDDAKAAALLACWSTGFGTIEAAHALADAGLEPERLYLAVLDELWQALRVGHGMADRVDALTRLNRNEGVGQLMISHTMKDLESLASEEDRAKARGFVERAAIKILGGLPASEMPWLSQVMAMSQTEQEILTSWQDPAPLSRRGEQGVPPGRGKFLIKVGNRPGIAFKMELTPAEMSVHDTNKRWAQAMGRRRA